MIKNKEILKKLEILFEDYFKNIQKLKENFAFFKENIIKKISFMNEIINFYLIKTKENNIKNKAILFIIVFIIYPTKIQKKPYILLFYYFCIKFHQATHV
jgi:hypothetical protein